MTILPGSIRASSIPLVQFGESTSVYTKLIMNILQKFTRMKKKVIPLILVLGLLSSCTAVKEYEKVNINDPDMVLSGKPVDRFETNFQAYREAASGANGGKTGGGCGCN